MVDWAGGVDGLGRDGQDSERMDWEKIRRYDPEIILLMPCSFSIARSVKERSLLERLAGWERVNAVRNKRVFAIEGAFFHRPGPRLVIGLQIMAALFHPDLFPKPLRTQARAF